MDRQTNRLKDGRPGKRLEFQNRFATRKNKLIKKEAYLFPIIFNSIFNK